MLHLVTGERPFSSIATIKGLKKAIKSSHPLKHLSYQGKEKIDKYPGLESFLLTCFETEHGNRYEAGDLLVNEFLHPKSYPKKY